MQAIMEVMSGRFIDVFNPKVEDIEIEDIIHGLAHLCRFGGHTSRHYSVAEHSVNVSYLVPEEHALQGLMHDATEAYLVDLPTPIKKHWPFYYEVEARLHGVICERFGIDPAMPESVREADARICITEKIQLISEDGLDNDGWKAITSKYEPYDESILFISRTNQPPSVIRHRFRTRFKALMELKA